MSKILFRSKNDEKIDEIKFSLESILSEISKSERQLFSYEEVENMLLDVYSVTNKK